MQSDKELTRSRPTVGVPALAERNLAIRHLKLNRKLHVKQDFFLGAISNWSLYLTEVAARAK